MKESYFEDIGKRLYDEEAEPPKNGWNKINDALNAPSSGDKQFWLKRYWWLPLLFIVSTGTYVAWQHYGNAVSLTRTAARSSLVALLDNSTETTDMHKTQSAREDNGVQADCEHPIRNTAQTEEILTNKPLSVKLPNHVSSINVAGDTNEYNKHDNAQALLVSAQQQSSDAHVMPTVSHGNPKQNAFNRTPVGSYPSLTTDRPNKKEEGIVSSGFSSDSTTTAVVRELISIIPPSDSSSMKEDDHPVEARWRITASFTPLTFRETITPNGNDDVLITSTAGNGGSRRMGYSIGIGAGRIISPSFIIDGEISFIHGQQNIGFSTATGNIDTLIATQQSNRVVLVPVYETINRTVVSKYGYAGVKIGGSWYFMKSAHGRFNVSANGGAYFKVHGSVRESVAGKWTKRSSADLSNTNFTLTLGAGYNLALNEVWELSINPSTTWFSRGKSKSDLPYALNQRSFGVNFMVSRKLK